MFNVDKCEIKSLPNELLIPNIISKYPNTNLPYINIPDSVVASHCFPKGLLNKIISCEKEYNKKSKITEDWIFSLDNVIMEDKYSSLKINKLYYTCYLFYEDVDNYKKLATYRRKTTCKNVTIIEDDKNEKLLIPKVLCISSFTPLYKHGRFLLHTIKKYVENFNYDYLLDKNNFYPIEKIIEGIIFNLPGLPRGNFVIKLNKETFYNEKNEENDNKTYRAFVDNTNHKNTQRDLIFEESPINKKPRALINYSLIMTFFRIEEIFDIIKSIILEEPILFFCEDIQNLTHTIEGILALIYPLEYPYPVVSVLPEENYSLINAFNHFIFGINCQFSEDLMKQKIINLDGKKCVVIVRIENNRFSNPLNSTEKDKLKFPVVTVLKANKKKPLIKLDQLKNYGVDKNKNSENNIQEKKKPAKLPIHYRGKCIKRLEPLISSKIKEASSKKKNLSTSEKDRIFNNEIIENFLYFFTCILLNYQEFCIKYDQIKNCVVLNDSKNSDSYRAMESLTEEEFNYCFERKKELEEKYITNKLTINDMFNCAGFIASIATLDRLFYERFFQTKIFYNFIKKKIFPCSIQDKLEILYFDDKINEKLSRESKMKKIDTKFIEDDLRNLTGVLSIGSFKQKINDQLKSYLSDKKNCDKGLNYFQYIIKDTDNKTEKKESSKDDERDSNNDKEKIKDDFKFYYFVFPKLLNDGIFFKEKKDEEYNSEDDLKTKQKFTSYNSNCLYNQFENEGTKIINNHIMTANYINHSYSLNPFSSYQKNYIDYIVELWLQFLSKTFYSIPFSQKMNYFDQILQFLKKYRSIEDNTIIMLFNTIYKYGDRNMNQEFFIFLRNKTYTSFLLLREKTKSKNNYIDFRHDSGNSLGNNKEKDKDKNNYGKLHFFVNSFCINSIENDGNNNNNNNEKVETNICNEPITDEIDSLFNDEEKFIQFECKKCLKKQAIIISCFYEKNKDLKYHINFRLVSPSEILKQKWFKNSNEIDISYIRKEYMEFYLSALFYFNQQGFVFDFLLPKTILEKQLSIESNTVKNNGNIVENSSKMKVTFGKREDVKKGHHHMGSALDLGDQNSGFFEQAEEKNGNTNKIHNLKKSGNSKKKLPEQ